MSDVLSGYFWEGLCYAREVSCMNLSGGIDSNGWFCTGVRKTILARNIYSLKTNPKPYSHSRYWVCMRLGNWDPRSTREYDIATAIVIWPITQPLTCKMGSSVFVAVSQLKVVSMTWASLTIIPSTKRTNVENIYVGRGNAARACPSSIFPTKEKSYPFLLSSKYPHQHLLTWRQWLLLSGYSIGPGFTRHHVFLEWYCRVAPPPSDILRPWRIRGFPHTQLWDKACLGRCMIFSCISLWRAMARPLFLHLMVFHTKSPAGNRQIYF